MHYTLLQLDIIVKNDRTSGITSYKLDKFEN
jgi:hypothetical protein